MIPEQDFIISVLVLVLDLKMSVLPDCVLLCTFHCYICPADLKGVWRLAENVPQSAHNKEWITAVVVFFIKAELQRILNEY